MANVEHLFISDVHLGAFDEEKEKEVEQRLTSLIDYAITQKAYLYILGDLFDYWMEYPKYNFVPIVGARVLDKFEEYNTTVRPAIFVTGNHDNWTFGHFSERGFDVEPKFRILTIGNANVLIMHGDGKFGKRHDLLRPLFHKILRNKLFTSIYQLLIPPSIGIALMKLFSNLTRKRNHSNPKPLSNHAEIILNSNPIDFFFCGHDHIPRKETFNNGTYINLGTFFNHGTLVRYKNNKFELVNWYSDKKEFGPFILNNSQK